MSDMGGTSKIKNNDNRGTVSASDKDEGQNNNKDRIAAAEEDIARLEDEIKELEAEKERLKSAVTEDETDMQEIVRLRAALKKSDAILEKEGALNDRYKNQKMKNSLLNGLKDQLVSGNYFAKANDIFPREKSELIERSGFKGAADKMTREKTPYGNDREGLYELEVKAFLKHLDEDGSIADMNSVAPSDASEEAGSQGDIVTPYGRGENSETCSSQPGKTRDRVITKHTSGSQKGGNARGVKPANLKRSIIPDEEEGHRGHQLPDAPTCAPWWSPVCLWALGEASRLNDFYEKIETETNQDEQQELEKRLRDALVLLATGTVDGSPGMRSSSRNILYVPDQHAEYYDTGYNWIIIPIMTLEEIKDWNGGSYEVAIFVGEHGETMEGSKNDTYNHFQDGPAKHSAVKAEAELFVRMRQAGNIKNIKICAKEDLIKVTDVLTNFLTAFADLHTRSLNDDGTRLENVSPRNWGIIDLSDAVKKAMEESNGTTKAVFEDSKKGIEDLIAKLLMKGSGSEEKGGIRIPKRPDTNCFRGKHVFKASVEQTYPPDPIFVGAKGTVNFGRQWGVRLLPDEFSLDSSSASWSGDEGHSIATPPFKDFTGFEIAVMTPESLALDKQATIMDDDGLHADAVSEVSTEDFVTADGEEAM